MKAMRRLPLLFIALATLLAAAELSDVRAVYIMPMGRGLDQYLANHLASGHVFQVVTDPKLADAMLTDRIGEQFQAQVEALLPPPPPPPDPTPAKETPKEKSRDAGDRKSDENRTPLSFTDTANHLENPAMNSSFGRGKGNIFLVDLKSRNVVWSVFEPARSSNNKELDHTASEIVSRLKKDLGLKK
jgi:hypothetical protein